MKIVLEYEPKDGAISAPGEPAPFYYITDLEKFELEEQETKDVEALIKLKNAGFTTEDIIELKRKELI